jgi:chemotaxis protein MotB
MRRKINHQEEPENHERWLISYSDFVTLLFGFFVVMYSISSVNQGKYRILSDALDEAFSKHDVAEPNNKKGKSDLVLKLKRNAGD